MRHKGDRMRRAVRRIHLWLGLGLGGVLVVLGLTGSVLAFYPELDALLHPEIRAVETGAESGGPPDWDQALRTVRETYPDKQGVWRFEVTGGNGAIPARYYNPPERAGYAFRPMMVWLSPDGGAVLRRDYWGEYAATFLYDLHYRLLLGETGGWLLGWTGFAMLALLLTGVWAWWPRGSWSKALRMKRHAHPQRALRDWHKLAGLSGMAFLLILTVTGIMLELPGESDAALVAAGLAVDAAPHIPDAPHDARTTSGTSPSAALRSAVSALPGARIAWIETPPVDGGLYRFRMQVAGDPSHRFPHSFVWVDRSGQHVLAVQNAAEASSGTTVNNWVHALHDGSAGGLAGRILVALAGVVPLVLFVTGFLRWRRRRG